MWWLHVVVALVVTIVHVHTPNQTSVIATTHQIVVTAMEVPCADASALVYGFLQEGAGLNMLHRDDKFLNCILDASKMEIEASTNNT